MMLLLIQALVCLFCSAIIVESVKIGISKPINTSEPVTTESIETDILNPATTTTTTKSPTTATTTKKPSQITKSSSTAPTSTAATPITTSTTTTTPLTTLKPPINDSHDPTSRMRDKNIAASRHFCTCNLKPNFCEINCCCDIDCIPEELNSFDCPQGEIQVNDLYYEQGLPPCRINEGWLCVFRTNIDVSKKMKQVNIPDMSSFHEWPSLLLEDNDFSKIQSFYRIGDPLLIFNLEINEFAKFEIPFSLNGHQCQVFEPVRHLNPKETSCHHTFEKAKQIEKMIFEKLRTSFLLQKPNVESPADGIIKQNDTGFIPISLFLCSREYDCVIESANDSLASNLDDIGYIQTIESRLTHNITNLLGCEVFFILSDERDETEVWVNYKVEFLQVNETQLTFWNVSGPFGYNAGSPLIISRKVLLNESGDNINSNRVLNYFHPNRTEDIHIHMPRRKQGLCESSQLTVNFGESVLIKCLVELDNSTELTSDTNFTKICGDLQRRSFKQLLMRNMEDLQEEYFLSTLGNPKNKTDSWIKIEVKNYEHLPVIGVYLNKENAFICQNMILGLKYSFLTLKGDVNGIQLQNLIKSAILEMGQRHDLQFQLDEQVSIPLTFSTLFYDVHETNNVAKLAPFWINCVLIALYYFCDI